VVSDSWKVVSRRPETVSFIAETAPGAGGFVALTERFQREVRALDAAHRAAVLDVVLGIPAAPGDPHRHRGLGLRKLHHSGVWEARVGLGLRTVFTLADGVATLVTVGTHEDVRRYPGTL